MSAFVTGGGGSIGSELVRQLIAAGEKVTVFELSELNLYNVEQSIKKNGKAATLLLGDIRHEYVLRKALAHAKPKVIYHAAALKHVPILEHPHNLIEAVRTNVLGTANVLKCAAEIGAHVVLISTDKAVAPKSVMGWTKHLAESLAPMMTAEFTGLNVSIVRFGNVIGSSGSVVPLFQKQIAAGGPVTITHPDMVRFFMTITEAVELVRTAYTLTEESSDKLASYVFDMGAPLRIMDVAENMIRFSGHRAGKDIQIKTIGLRPGEKLYEELTWPFEQLVETTNPKIRRIALQDGDTNRPMDSAFLTALSAACEERDVSELRAIMAEASKGWEVAC